MCNERAEDAAEPLEASVYCPCASCTVCVFLLVMQAIEAQIARLLGDFDKACKF